MFCPNCAAPNNAAQHYCRTCGLKLDTIAVEVAEQRPSSEYAELNRRKRRSEVSGIVSVAIAAVIALCMMMGKAFYYKLVLLGPDVLFRSAFGALLLFAVAAAFFFTRSKWLKPNRMNSRLAGEAFDVSRMTNKLPDAASFEPASVTEHSTELLSRERG